ncbi:ion transporter [Halorussus caseinilyticus]|uniref:Ion transporter n=1 Tax=Halorussus caseinilyticus TaxID=3034025 RepID=A0ABD5WII1_9EURY|nr:ion transporter [Halorussus sp. DT72]
MTGDSKRRVAVLLDSSGESSASRATNAFVGALILLNVVAVVLETIDPVYARYRTVFRLFELLSIVVFVVEFALRFWASTARPGYEGPVLGRLRFLVNPYAVADLLAILPFVLGVAALDLRFIRVVRAFWFLRLFRESAVWQSRQRFVRVVRARRADLSIAVMLAVLVFFVSSGLLYYAERPAGTFASIPDAMWWAVITLTTVGYGDVVPVTLLGRLFAGLTALGGIGLFALPASILAAGYEDVSEPTRSADADAECPNCGYRLDDSE